MTRADLLELISTLPIVRYTETQTMSDTREVSITLGFWTFRRPVGWRLGLVLALALTCVVCCG